VHIPLNHKYEIKEDGITLRKLAVNKAVFWNKNDPWEVQSRRKRPAYYPSKIKSKAGI